MTEQDQPQTWQEVRQKIDAFIEAHDAYLVDGLGHVALSDLNLSNVAIEDQLHGWLSHHAEAWIEEQIGFGAPYASKYFEVCRRAELWADVSQLIDFLNWLLYEVPEAIRFQVEEMDQ